MSGDIPLNPFMVEESVPDFKASKTPFASKVFPPKVDMPKGEPKPAAPKDKLSEKVVPKNKVDILSVSLPGMYSTLGAFVCMVDVPCGTAIIESADDCAKSLIEVAKNNPKVANALLKLMEGGAWGGVIVAHAPIIMAIAVHHKPQRKPKPEPRDHNPAGNGNLSFMRPKNPNPPDESVS